MKNESLLVCFLLSLSGCASTEVKNLDLRIFDKVVEIQQHNRLSIHLNEKCNYLSDSDIVVIENSSNSVGEMITNHPKNAVGKNANLLIDVKMHERSRQIKCNNIAKNEVLDTLKVANQFMDKIVLKR
jgi:hypothetical protein